MSDVFDQPDEAATPLSEEDKPGLKLSYISTRDELNAAEQENIAAGQEWALRRKRSVVDERFIQELHRRMLGDVWRWAGQYRTHEVNLGIPYWEVPVEIRALIDNTAYWIENETYPRDEIAIRFHHRMTHIHPFPNGNGRHARLIADLLIMQLGEKRFSWGSGGLRDVGDLRQRYVQALQAADRYDIEPLLAFTRS